MPKGSSPNGPSTRQSKLPESASQSRSRRFGGAANRVYEAVRHQILLGELEPGARLGHRTMAEAFGTSNGPVVSALRRLANDGLITYEPGQGGTVRDFSDDVLADWMVVRRALETEAARLAARRASPEDIERLYAIIDRMADVVRRQAWDEADRTDVELHRAIAGLTRSPAMIEALERCHLLEIIRRRLLASERRIDFERLDVNHRLLVDAIAGHDPDQAGLAMHRHLSQSSR